MVEKSSKKRELRKIGKQGELFPHLIPEEYEVNEGIPRGPHTIYPLDIEEEARKHSPGIFSTAGRNAKKGLEEIVNFAGKGLLRSTGATKRMIREIMWNVCESNDFYVEPDIFNKASEDIYNKLYWSIGSYMLNKHNVEILQAFPFESFLGQFGNKNSYQQRKLFTEILEPQLYDEFRNFKFIRNKKLRNKLLKKAIKRKREVSIFEKPFGWLDAIRAKLPLAGTRATVLGKYIGAASMLREQAKLYGPSDSYAGKLTKAAEELEKIDKMYRTALHQKSQGIIKGTEFTSIVGALLDDAKKVFQPTKYTSRGERSKIVRMQKERGELLGEISELGKPPSYWEKGSKERETDEKRQRYESLGRKVEEAYQEMGYSIVPEAAAIFILLISFVFLFTFKNFISLTGSAVLNSPFVQVGQIGLGTAIIAAIIVLLVKVSKTIKKMKKREIKKRTLNKKSKKSPLKNPLKSFSIRKTKKRKRRTKRKK